MVDFRFNAQFVKKAGASFAQQYVLGDAGEAVGVVQAAGDIAAFLVIFLQVRGKEEHGRSAECFRIQEVGFYPDGSSADMNEEFDDRACEELIHQGHTTSLTITPSLWIRRTHAVGMHVKQGKGGGVRAYP